MSIRSLFPALVPLMMLNLSCVDGPAFESNVFEDTSKQERELVRLSNKELVNQCSQNVSPTSKMGVYGISHGECGQNDVGYTMYPFEGGFNIDMKLGLSFSPLGASPREKAEMLEKTRSCLPQIQEVFKRYHFFLNIELAALTSGLIVYDNYITLSDTAGRSNAHRWHTRSFGYCLTVLHEISHLLTLDDEYPDEEKCPNRTFISKETNPVSIMNNTFVGFENVDLYPRHIKRILDPFCPSGNGTPPGLIYRTI